MIVKLARYIFISVLAAAVILAAPFIVCAKDDAKAELTLPETAEAYVNHSVQLDYRLSVEDEAGRKSISLSWSSSNSNIATVNSSGLVTGKASGTAVITLKASDGAKARCTVTVTEVMPKGILLHADTLVGYPLGTLNMSAEVYPYNAADLSVSWKSSDDSVAKISEDGKVSLIHEGTAHITATACNGITRSLRITVTGPKTAVALPPSITLHADNMEKRQLVLKRNIPEDGPDPRLVTVKWVSSDEEVATVDKGLVTAHSPGIAAVTATTADGATATCNVLVTCIEAEAVYIESDWLEGAQGDRIQLVANVSPDNTYDKTLVWRSLNPGVASVDENGLVLLRGSGTSMITATATNGVKSYVFVRCGSGRFRNKAWFYQGTSRHEGTCYTSSVAIVITNLGVYATPEQTYYANSSGITTAFFRQFGMKAACALSPDSPYLKEFDRFGRTIVRDPANNGIEAIKEALDLHPEGVICYFSSGGESHAQVAMAYKGDKIYWSDPGRGKREYGYAVPFSETWASKSHHMTMANLVSIIAMDPAF